MVIIETTVFTRQVDELLTGEEYRRLQLALVLNPYLGAVIPGSGGLRKMRWLYQGHGKRGGVRVIYYLALAQGHILMLFIYPKNFQGNLTPAQLKVLRKIIEEEYP